MLSNRRTVKQLWAKEQPNCISMYIKTHRSGEAEGDKIRWKNACDEASSKLLATGMEEREIRKILRPATDLLSKDDFWLHLSDCLCMFIGDDYVEKYVLPIDFINQVSIGDRFFLSPLLSYFKNRQRFFLLDLSLNHIRFFECNKHHITSIKIDDLVPMSVSQTNIAEDTQKNLQVHGSGVHHGHGGGNDSKQRDIDKFVRLIDKGLASIYLRENVPLVLSGDSGITSAYNRISSYSNVLETTVQGNNQHTDPAMLHELAYSIMLKEYLPTDNEMLKIYFDLEHTDKTFKGTKEMQQSLMQKKLKQVFVSEDYKNLNETKLKELDSLILQAFELDADIDFINVENNEEMVMGINYF